MRARFSQIYAILLPLPNRQLALECELTERHAAVQPTAVGPGAARWFRYPIDSIRAPLRHGKSKFLVALLGPLMPRRELRHQEISVTFDRFADYRLAKGMSNFDSGTNQSRLVAIGRHV